jgi:hypothetical protein
MEYMVQVERLEQVEQTASLFNHKVLKGFTKVYSLYIFNEAFKGILKNQKIKRQQIMIILKIKLIMV